MKGRASAVSQKSSGFGFTIFFLSNIPSELPQIVFFQVFQCILAVVASSGVSLGDNAHHLPHGDVVSHGLPSRGKGYGRPAPYHGTPTPKPYAYSPSPYTPVPHLPPKKYHPTPKPYLAPSPTPYYAKTTPYHAPSPTYKPAPVVHHPTPTPAHILPKKPAYLPSPKPIYHSSPKPAYHPSPKPYIPVKPVVHDEYHDEVPLPVPFLLHQELVKV